MLAVARNADKRVVMKDSAWMQPHEENITLETFSRSIVKQQNGETLKGISLSRCTANLQSSSE